MWKNLNTNKSGPRQNNLGTGIIKQCTHPLLPQPSPTQRHVSYSTWYINVLNGMPIFHFGVPRCQKACQNFKYSSYEMLREISMLYYYIKFYIILDIIILHMISVCIVHKNCIMLHVYTSCHIKEKRVDFPFFETFWFFS